MPERVETLMTAQASLDGGFGSAFNAALDGVVLHERPLIELERECRSARATPCETDCTTW